MLGSSNFANSFFSKVEFENTYKQGEFDREDMRTFERFHKWENYVEERE